MCTCHKMIVMVAPSLNDVPKVRFRESDINISVDPVVSLRQL